MPYVSIQIPKLIEERFLQEDPPPKGQRGRGFAPTHPGWGIKVRNTPERINALRVVLAHNIGKWFVYSESCTPGVGMTATHTMDRTAVTAEDTGIYESTVRKNPDGSYRVFIRQIKEVSV